MNLVIDIGNTLAKLVVFDEGTPVEETRTDNKTLEALPAVLSRYDFSKAIVAAVVDITPMAEALLSRLPFPTVRLTPDTPIPLIHNHYGTPRTLGADRIGAVVGAVSQRPGRDVLVIDCGTCITYEFVDSGGNYRGGNISPGLNMRLRALHERTARLPLIVAKGDTPPMGHDTETAIRSGVVMGIRHEIEGYVGEFAEKYPDLCVFMTGGCRLRLDLENPIVVDKYLVARGMNTILEHNT